MSILIKGMEIPKYCGECKLKVEYDDEAFCPFFTDNIEYWIAARRRHEDCPLVSVPPHEDLIDRDVLIEKKWDADTRCGYVQVVDVGDIINAPVIIEAEDK